MCMCQSKRMLTSRGRSRTKVTCKWVLSHKRRDQEPSRIPLKRIVNVMRKNKARRQKIKFSIKRFIRKSYLWHRLLSIAYRKDIFYPQTNQFYLCKRALPRLFKNIENHHLFLKNSQPYSTRKS